MPVFIFINGPTGTELPAETITFPQRVTTQATWPQAATTEATWTQAVTTQATFPQEK